MVADLVELDEVTDQVDPIVEEASNFVATITSLYDDNEGYAPAERVGEGNGGDKTVLRRV